MTIKVSDEIQAAAATEFSTIETLIVENYGKVTSNLEDPKLTHIVLFKKDLGRRVELMRKTQKYVLTCHLWLECIGLRFIFRPKLRHLVLTTFVKMCVQEESILDEDAFAP